MSKQQAEMCQHIETHPSVSMGLGTSKYARCRQKKGKEDRSENPNKVQDPSEKELLIPATSTQTPNGQETSICAVSDDSAPCPETSGKGEDRTKIPSNQTSENKKTKNDGGSGLSTATDDTSLDVSDQGDRNDARRITRAHMVRTQLNLDVGAKVSPYDPPSCCRPSTLNLVLYSVTFPWISCLILNETHMSITLCPAGISSVLTISKVPISSSLVTSLSQAFSHKSASGLPFIS